MSGIELAGYARRKFPDMNIIVISGEEKPPLPVSINFLQKPFPLSTLLNIVRSG